jgi:hypothetical protein
VVSEQAATAGVASVPTGFAEIDSDMFFVYEQVMGTFRSVGTDAGPTEPTGTQHRYDSKAMRRVEPGQDVASCLEASAISSGAIVVWSFRQLLKLH